MDALQQRTRRLLLIFGVFFILVAILYLRIGDIKIPFHRLLPILTGNATNIEEFVILRLRLPRMLIVIFAGMALSMSGSLLQSLTGNDLADPGIIGINAGAGIGVTIFFLFFSFEAKSFAYLLPLAAFVGAFATALLIFFFSYQKKSGIHPYKIILVGIGFSMALSGLMILLISSAERDEVQFISSWLAGNIWGGDWPFVLATLPILVLTMTYVFFQMQTLNIIQLGEETAIGLGVHLQRKQLMIMVAATLLAATAVSVVGSIAFIGLLSPHIAKRLVGIKNQRFLPIAMMIGGLLLFTADLLAKNLIEPNGLPTGILVALIGAPYFIYLIIRNNH